MKLAVVGGGRMGRALVGGLLRSGWLMADDITVVELVAEARSELAERFPGVPIATSCGEADAAVLAVKPADAEVAARAVAGAGVPRVLSIMAGITIAELEPWCGSAVVLRAMPNVPAVLGSGASGLAGGGRAGEEDFAWAEAVLSSFGVVARMPEKLLDAVTGLSGSGPAYVFLIAEALVEAGVAQGLDRDVSELLVTATLLGSARLLSETGERAETLRASITSPGGTTAAGLRVLEAHRTRSALIEAVAAATERSKELGRR
ncbi:MAG: pyrroline-5-carboxylate reductase [Acidimicrobiales bacterium]